jgi:hypothetical protein
MDHSAATDFTSTTSATSGLEQHTVTDDDEVQSQISLPIQEPVGVSAFPSPPNVWPPAAPPEFKPAPPSPFYATRPQALAPSGPSSVNPATQLSRGETEASATLLPRRGDRGQ